jgi:penicillin-binding protein activator
MNPIKNKTFTYAGLLFSLLILAACSGPQVRYGDAKAVETVNANYGSTDLQTIAEAMTRSLLQSKAISGSKDAPIVTVADVKNKTSEYIDTSVITDKIRTQLVKSGQVRFAVNTNEMQNQVDELKRQNQSGLYKNSTISKTGNMQGAQYRIEGSISSIVKQTKNVKDVYYVFNLNLINNETGLLEWADEKEIRKTATR